MIHSIITGTIKNEIIPNVIINYLITKENNGTLKCCKQTKRQTNVHCCAGILHESKYYK